jgi:prepilin-type N-terminal cleavage/methylation domain-containing protein
MAVKKRAFSLIEISIAIVLISLIVSGTLGVFSQGFSYLKKYRERTVAYNLGREVMERYFTWPLPADGTHSNPAPYYPVTLNNVTYNVNLTISPDPVYPTAMKQISVVISWGTQSYTLVSLKANY